MTLALRFSGTNISLPVELSGGPGGVESLEVNFRTVAADYFETLEIPLVEGRYAFQRSTPGNAREAVVSQAVARRLGRSPLGLTLRLDADAPDGFEIVGVVGDVRHHELAREREPEVYLGYESYPMNWGYFVARTDRDPMDLVPAVRRAAAELDPEQPLYSITPLDELITRPTGSQRLVVLIAMVFAGSALLIMASGIYGVVSASVARLTPELGLRSALGARDASAD